MARLVTLQDLRNDPLITTLIAKGNDHLGVLGYTNHGKLHVTLVADLCLRYWSNWKSGAEKELQHCRYLHDIGNVINRRGHSQSGALLAMTIMRRMGMDPAEIAVVAGAIGNHDEGNGQPISRVAAALILADKSHVHRSRVRNRDISTFDIHDRVNYAVNESILRVNGESRVITMELCIETEICPVMEYFEIFLTRMVMCRRAAAFLECQFELLINGAKLL